MISATSSLAALSQGQGTPPADRSKELGKEDFLKLLVAQLKNQDPLNPVENTEMVTQLAQFSSLEAAMGTNERLDALTAQTQGLASTEATALVGKNVVVQGNVLNHRGSGALVPFEIAAPAADVKLTIFDMFGNEVSAVELGSLPAGEATVGWDGTDAAGQPLPPGQYVSSVEATTEAGDQIAVTQRTSGQVTEVTFSGGEAILRLDNGVSAPASELLSVIAP